MATEPTPVALTPKPDEASIACTLDGAAVPDRLSEWQAVLTHTRRRTTSADGSLRVELDDALRLDELARLVEAEQSCCSFFSFAITVDARGVGLEVRAPDGAADIVAALFGSPA